MTIASEIETNQSTLDEIVQRIVDGFNPQRIILFGSWARGSAGPDSDVDLLIVMNVATMSSAASIALRRSLLRPRGRGRSSMSGRPDRLLEAQRWAEKAGVDRRNAEHTLTLEVDCPFDPA
jgi:predicted nucleotidyltransferase